SLPTPATLWLCWCSARGSTERSCACKNDGGCRQTAARRRRIPHLLHEISSTHLTAHHGGRPMASSRMGVRPVRTCTVAASRIARSAILLVCLILMPSMAGAQQASGIAGVARDTSGAVLPGVSVEAASPALIEKVRTVVTDGEGQYKILDLLPGTYAVTFSLSGFTTVRREGIVLQAGFTATGNVDMQVGAVAETSTVAGASPVVDTQNTRQQKVLSDQLLQTLPTGSRAPTTYISLVPGLVGGADVGGSGGIQNSNAVWQGWYHGKGAISHRFDATSFETQYNSVSFIANPFNVEEVVVQTGGVSADTDSMGVVINMIPKDGGNSFKGYAYGVFGNDHLQSDNLSDELRARGVTT